MPLYRIWLTAAGDNRHPLIEASPTLGKEGVPWTRARAFFELMSAKCGTGTDWPIVCYVVPA